MRERGRSAGEDPKDTIKNLCDALSYCRACIAELDPENPLIPKVDVTLQSGRDVLAKVIGGQSSEQGANDGTK